MLKYSWSQCRVPRKHNGRLGELGDLGILGDAKMMPTTRMKASVFAKRPTILGPTADIPCEAVI
jgi:hypothetical protein